ncbi:MAG: oligoendopeptidase F [Firmicutes bacterium]|nr:oligoendopeptidase F [Bacillota bacterium]
MKRSEVKEEYKWRRADIFLNDADWERNLAVLNKDIVGILQFKGRLSCGETLLKCFALSDDLSKRLEKLYCYAMLYKDENLALSEAAAMKSRVETLYVSFSAYSAYIVPELSAQPDSVLEGYIADPDFSMYDYQLKNILAQKKHILSEGEERVLALAGKTIGAFREIFTQLDNVDMPFPNINADGKPQKMTHGKYSLWLQSENRDLRKRAFSGMYKAVGAVVHTAGANFAASVNKDNFLAQVRGYNSALEKSLKQNDVPAAVYDTLLTQVSAFLPALHEYMAFRKKTLGYEKLHMYDLHVPLFPQASLGVSFDKAYELVIDGLKPLGAAYTEVLRAARTSRWLDVEETQNKRSGAYSCGVYGVHPYVLLNYKPLMHDVFTVAHEMGHAVHSYESAKYQPYAKNDYAIFVAEVASTVNEVLLLKHLLSETKDINTKKYLLSYYLDMFRTTLFRQTMFAEFEAQAHALEAEGTPLTVDRLNKLYASLNKKYYGTDVTQDKQIRLEWARIPHFYNAFYVYQYATGLTSAVSLANAIRGNKADAQERYKAFLRAGGSKSPYEILKDAGVDLLDASAYKTAFTEFTSALEELKNLQLTTDN